MENFNTGIQTSYQVNLDVTRSEFRNGVNGIILGSSITLFGIAYFKFEGNTMKSISQIGLEIRAISNTLNIGSWQSDTNIFDNCSIGIKITEAIKVFISRTRIVNSLDKGIIVQYYSRANFKSFIFKGLGKNNIETFNNNRNGHIHVLGYSYTQAIIEITDSKVMTINENSQSLSWTGVLIKDLTNPFIRVENNTFVCDGIYFDDQQFIKYNLSIENCNTILPGSTISNNQFDLSNMINCRALNVFHASPYKQSDFVIEDNVITSSNNKSCIFHFQTCDKFVCNNNYFNINQNPPYSSNLFYVVHHHGGANAVVESNVIVVNSKLREGIFIEAVDDRICHNAVYGCNQGLYIDGTGMDIYSNSMNDNTIGLTVNKVKPQRHTGNYWLGYNLIEGKCKSNPLLSIFISNQNNYNQNVKKYWPTSVTPNLFVHHDTVSPNDCFINLPFKYFLIDSYRINNLSEVEKWENDRLFIKTVLDSPQYLQSYDVYSYLSNFVNSNLYFLVNAEREIERRNYIPDTLLDKYYIYVSEYRQLSLLYSYRFNIVFRIF